MTDGNLPSDAKGKALEKAGAQLKKLVMTTVQDGVGPLAGSATYAKDRLERSGSRKHGRSDTQVGATSHDDPEAAIRRVIRESVAASGTQGFVTGLGGLAAMPVTLPANMAGGLIINARMVGAIAHLRGYDLADPHTQAMLMLTVAGSSAQSALSEIGVVAGKQAAKHVIERIPMAVIHQINKKASFYLVAKYGTQRSTITLAKLVPGVGGIVGGGVDATLTRSIGAVAKKVFPPT